MSPLPVQSDRAGRGENQGYIRFNTVLNFAGIR